ncbi:MAG: endonuclease [Bacteroidia bacterium]|nr:MAG: endonuclease [Bacteroidia bacterium]
MSKKLFIIFSLIVLFIANSCSTKKEQADEKIAAKTDNTEKIAKHADILFYNVENLFDLLDDPIKKDEDFTPNGKLKWTQERYDKKLENLAKVISAVDSTKLPVMVGLAEVENKKVVEDLVANKKLASANYQIVHEESPDFRGIDVAFFYNPSFFTYIKHATYRIQLKEEPEFVSRDILYVSGVAAGKDTLHVFVNHWSSRRGGVAESEFKRLAFATKLRTKVDSIFALNPDAKIIIMGDMNDSPTNKSIHITLNASNNKNTTDKTELYNLMYEKHLKHEGTHNYKGEWNMLDNLIVSQALLNTKKGLSTQHDAGKIFKPRWIQYKNKKYDLYAPSRTYGGGNYYGGFSDHFPIYFTIQY